MSGSRVLSNRTWVIAALGIVVSAVSIVLIRAGVGGSDSGRTLIANLPSLLTGGGAAAAGLWTALRFERTEGLRRQWLLLGLGTAALFIGDTTFAYLQVVNPQEVPFPSVADFFYLISFPILAGGLLMALFSFRRSMSLRAPMLLATAVAAVATAGLWAIAFQPILADTEASSLEKFLGILYPVGDIWLLLLPALALAMALSHFAGGRLAWSWWTVVVGLTLVMVADVLFGVLDFQGTYATGSFVDMGWWFGYTAIAVGASIAVDVHAPRKAGARS